MHSLAKKFMMARKLNFGEDGIAELMDERVFMMDGDMLAQIAATAGDEAAYSIGQNVGLTVADNIERTGLSGTKMTEFMMDLLTMMGLGEFEIHTFDLATKDGEVRVRNCIIDDETGTGQDANCAIIAGVIAGVFSENYDADFTAEEVACACAGEDMCRFKISKDD